MKRIYTLLICVVALLPMMAQSVGSSQIQIAKQSVSISENNMIMVGMDITIPADMEISSDRVLTLTPVLKTNDDSQNKVLPEVVVYGRRRAIVHEREGNVSKDAFEILRRKNGTEQVVNYTARIPFEPWMNGATLDLMADLCGCANHVQEEDMATVMPVNLIRYTVVPHIAFVTPEVEEVKARAEEGKAYLDFPVNKTIIYPEYRKNPEELKKIIATIDLVKNDQNTRITEIDIVGYASPEGSYNSNARLAQARSEALKKYVQDLYHFEQDIIKVSSIPEDWQGLRKYVANSSFVQKEEMLSLLDDENLSYDARELRLKTFDGGKAYTTLLNDCYPALRHSDYTVQYVVRGFSVDEAKEIITKRPQLLSLNEMFQVAQTYESGSDEFKEVFEVAVRMFPDDPTANINAAAIELQQGNWKQAERYLLKSDPQVSATKNNEGVMWMMQGQLDKAEALFQQAKALGSAEAEKNLEEIAKKRQDNALYGE
ncbi:MAG: DUF3868 domain-containing protein [Bacteroidaceae bacterium]|nr:DUF3868 domain-containing protein [Bacteroidaceae bacterium]